MVRLYEMFTCAYNSLFIVDKQRISIWRRKVDMEKYLQALKDEEEEQFVQNMEKPRRT